MKLKEMTIKQIINECKKHTNESCLHCPFCKDIWLEQNSETGERCERVECEVRGILDNCEEKEKEEYDL